MVVQVQRKNFDCPVAITCESERKAQLLQAIQNKNIDRVVLILQTAPQTANEPLNNGEMPLHFAIRTGDCDLVAQMMKQSSDICISAKDHQNLTPLDHALIMRDQKMISVILAHTIGKNLEIAKEKVLHDQEKLDIHALCSNLLNLRSQKFENIPLLHQAVLDGNVNFIENLSFSNIKLNLVDSFGMTPLHYAVLKGNETIADRLIEKGADPHLETSDKQSILHLAVISGNVHLLQKLLRFGKFDVNAVDSKGWTPLHYAVALENLAIMQNLVQCGANPQYTSRLGASPLEMMLYLTQVKGPTRDPLVLSNLQCYLFSGIVLSWISFYLGQDNPLSVALNVAELAVGGLTFLSMWSLMKSFTSKLAFLGMCYINLTPGLSTVFQAWRAYTVGQGVIQGLAVCWKNRFLETYRPIRNAIVHGVTGYQIVKDVSDELTHTQSFYEEIVKFKKDWGKFTEESNFWKQPPELRQRLYRKFIDDWFGGDLSQKPDNCSPINPDICKDKDVTSCILDPTLDPKCEQHARVILGITDNANCSKSWRKLVRIYGDGKREANPAAFLKIKISAQTLGCVRNNK